MFFVFFLSGSDPLARVPKMMMMMVDDDDDDDDDAGDNDVDDNDDDDDDNNDGDDNIFTTYVSCTLVVYLVALQVTCSLLKELGDPNAQSAACVIS